MLTSWFENLFAQFKKMPFVQLISKSAATKALAGSMPAARLACVSLIQDAPKSIAVTNEAFSEFAEQTLRNR